MHFFPKNLLFVLLLLGSVTQAQETKPWNGRVTDSLQTPIPGATVKAFFEKDSIQTITNAQGFFSLPASLTGGFRIRISSIGFTPYARSYTPDAELLRTRNLGVFQLGSGSDLLPEAVVVAQTPITIKEDTIEYKASAYKVRDGAPVEDVIKKLPDVTVDKDGKITAQGKPVSRIRVNGKDFFGGDLQTATKNLPANIIDNIQIIDDYGDQANITGVKKGEPEKIININIQKNKNKGYFGSASIAGGTDGRYAAGLNANRFNEEQQLSFLGSVNNTNTNIFDFNGGGRGGGVRGVSFGTSVGGSGITQSWSGGLNYRDKWGKKLSVNGSYSFSTRNSNSINASFQQDIDPQNTRATTRNGSSNSKGGNHRITFNAEYKIDSLNYIKLSPYYSISSSSNASESNSAISRPGFYTYNVNKNAGESRSPSAGGDLMYNHRFHKKGRNLNIRSSINYSYRSQDQLSHSSYLNKDSTYFPVLETDTLQYQAIYITNQNISQHFSTSYSEPIGKKPGTAIDFNYEWSHSDTRNVRDVNDIDPLNSEQNLNPNQSNHFNYTFTTHQAGLNLHSYTKKFNYNLGVMVQPSLLSGQTVGKAIQTHYRNTNWIPNGRFSYTLGKSHTITLSMGGSSNQPDFMQLQPVTDSSNLNNIVVGNPNLQAELSRRASIQYNRFNSKTGQSYFTSFYFNQTDNKIVSSRVNNSAGTGRTTSYLNTNGFYSLGANGSFTKPFFNRKFIASLSFSGNYSNNISYSDNLRNNGKNWTLRPNLSLRVDLDDIVDAAVNIGYTHYQTTTEYTKTGSTTTTRAQTLSIGINGKNYFFKDWTLGYDLSKLVNYGFSSSVNSNPVVLNVFGEYRFLKNKLATLRLQAYDLLNQNTGISRSVSGTTITDSRNNRLARYFLLTFNMRLQKFGGAAKGTSTRERQQRY